jgi:hypothetical protein
MQHFVSFETDNLQLPGILLVKTLREPWRLVDADPRELSLPLAQITHGEGQLYIAGVDPGVSVLYEPRKSIALVGEDVTIEITEDSIYYNEREITLSRADLEDYHQVRVKHAPQEFWISVQSGTLKVTPQPTWKILKDLYFDNQKYEIYCQRGNTEDARACAERINRALSRLPPGILEEKGIPYPVDRPLSETEVAYLQQIYPPHTRFNTDRPHDWVDLVYEALAGEDPSLRLHWSLQDEDAQNYATHTWFQHLIWSFSGFPRAVWENPRGGELDISSLSAEDILPPPENWISPASPWKNLTAFKWPREAEKARRYLTQYRDLMWSLLPHLHYLYLETECRDQKSVNILPR